MRRAAAVPLMCACLLACALAGASALATSATTPSRLVWSDEFNGRAGAPPDPAKWDPQVGGNGWGNNELQSYTARTKNAALDGRGHLAITARRESYTAGDGVTRAYTSARLQTLGLFATTYGRLEARVKVPAGKGLLPAFWALGSDIDTVGWPQSGEIDAMEVVGDDPSTVVANVHGPLGTSGRTYAVEGRYAASKSLARGFHVFGAIWRPGRIEFTIDGSRYKTVTAAQISSAGSWVFDKPFFLLLNLAVGGDWPGAPNAGTRFPATMLVDWVRVYQ